MNSSNDASQGMVQAAVAVFKGLPSKHRWMFVIAVAIATCVIAAGNFGSSGSQCGDIDVSDASVSVPGGSNNKISVVNCAQGSAPSKP